MPTPAGRKDDRQPDQSGPAPTYLRITLGEGPTPTTISPLIFRHPPTACTGPAQRKDRSSSLRCGRSVLTPALTQCCLPGGRKPAKPLVNNPVDKAPSLQGWQCLVLTGECSSFLREAGSLVLQIVSPGGHLCGTALQFGKFNEPALVEVDQAAPFGPSHYPARCRTLRSGCQKVEKHCRHERSTKPIRGCSAKQRCPFLRPAACRSPTATG